MIAISVDAARMLLDRIAEGNVHYPCQFHVQIGWPYQVTYDGRNYFSSGKQGVRISDSMPCAEYRADRGRRVWLGADGEIRED